MGVATETALANMALYRIGEKAIDDIETPDNVAGRLCALFYPQTRDEVLQDFDWSCATWRQTLQAISVELVPNLCVYDYQYRLPVDPYCLRVIVPIDAQGTSPTYDDIDDDYQVEERMLQTELTPCAIKYIRRLTDPTLFDAQLVELIVVRLGSKIAARLRGKNDRAGRELLQEYLVQRNNARSLDNLNKKPRHKPAAKWSTVT